MNISIFLTVISFVISMERGCGGETPVGYFTLNYYSLPKISTKCAPMICNLQFTFFFQFNKNVRYKKRKE
jgi:hypothetical protein